MTLLDTIQELSARDAAWAVSHYVPLEPAGSPAARQNDIRFKNIVSRTRDALGDRDLPERLVEATLSRLEGGMADASRSTHGGGVAVFIAPDVDQAVPLPARPNGLMVLSGRFHLTPLWADLENLCACHVLWVSMGGARLLAVEQASPVRELDLSAEASAGVRHAGRALEWPRDLQLHSVPAHADAAIYHGQGGREGPPPEYLRRYVRDLDAEVCRKLVGSEAPLVFAGEASLWGLYRAINRYPHLCDERVAASSSRPLEADLPSKARAIARRVYDARRAQMLDSVLGAGFAERGVCDIRTVVSAAVSGCVDTLVLAPDRPVWGRIDRLPGAAPAHGDAAEIEDLVNAAAVFTTRYGGRVLTAGAEHLPEPASPVAALLRHSSTGSQHGSVAESP